MAQKELTFSDRSKNGAADQTITNLDGLPSGIPANATLDSVVLSFTCNRTGGRDDNEIRVQLGDTIYYYIQDLGKNDPRTCDITGIVRNNSGTLTYLNGGTILRLYGYHAFKLFDNANWSLTNIKITANYTLKHTVTLNPNGGSVSPTSVVFDDGDTYGTLPTPTKDGHTFNYWTKEDGTRIYSSTKITSSHTLVANWTVNSYSITVKTNNDSYGRVGGGGTFDYGGYTTLFAEPYAGYKVVGWDDGVAATDPTWSQRSVWVYGDATYIAIFEPITYTVTFKDENGATLKTETVNYGSTVTAPSDPIKADTAQWDYTFDGWYDDSGNKWYSSSTIKSDTTYTARFTSSPQVYIVRWFNYDGTQLGSDVEVPYGEKPVYSGETPTKASDNLKCYSFVGWTPEVDFIVGDADYTAVFAETDRYYTVRWLNAKNKNGEQAELEVDEVLFETQPDYNGSTDPEHPDRETDPEYSYTFIGWSAEVTEPAKPDTELEKVKGDITYTAVYAITKKLYAVRVVLFDSEYTSVVEYGSKLVLEAPAVTGYRFTQWNDGNTDNPRTITVTGEATYQAVYERVSIPIIVNNEQVTGVYIVPTTQTIVYIITGEVPAVETNGVRVDGWKFEVSNNIPDNSYPLKWLLIGSTRVY